jgi:hypothetical protein
MENIELEPLRIEEYKAIRSQIDNQSRLQVQVFTFSIISASALIGYLLKFFEQDDINTVTVYIFLVPTLIYIPCAYLIKDMRDEIYRWGTYIHIFIENENSQYYEGALGSIRDRFSSSESFNPMFTAYWAFTVVCMGLFLFFIVGTEMMWWTILPWLVVIYSLGNAHIKFNLIPSKGRANYIQDWKSIKSASKINHIKKNSA